MAHVTKGNVFEDLGFDREEAIDLAMKVDLAYEIRKFIERVGVPMGAPRAEAQAMKQLRRRRAHWLRMIPHLEIYLDNKAIVQGITNARFRDDVISRIVRDLATLVHISAHHVDGRRKAFRLPE